MTGETFNNQSSHPRVALLGTGTMGAGMAQRMLDLAFQSSVWNRTPGPAAATGRARCDRPRTSDRAPWLPQRSS